MAYKIERFLVPGFRNVDIGLGLYTYTFIFRISSHEKLPPSDYCDVIHKFVPVMLGNHSIGSIWVQVDAPGLWYPIEIRRGLSISKAPVAVTRVNSNLNPKLSLADFNFKPYTSGHKLPPPVYEADWVSPVSENELACLRVLGRLNQGLTSEIASLAGSSIRTTHDVLSSLAKNKFVDHVFPAEQKDSESLYSERYPFWRLRQLGLRTALRSWGVPPGIRFSSRLEETHGYGEISRHKINARQWLALLRENLGGVAEIWEGWTEVRLTDMRQTPDALAWGKFDNRETLFWLEVESGHMSGEEMLNKIDRRFRGAVRYANERDICLVFGVLAYPWVQNAIKMAFMDMPASVAVIMGNWTEFGKLPIPKWGQVRSLED